MALAVGVVGCHTVAHLAFALHGGVADAAGETVVQRSEVFRIACPKLSLVDEDIVVVAEPVVLAYYGVGMVEVILHLV